MGILSSLMGAGTKLLGGFMGQKSADKQMQLQKDFAKKAIQWKVADAKAAGIHPLYALGANTVSYSPMSVGGDLASGITDMGQDISRAVEAVSNRSERTAAGKLASLQLERASLENDLLRTQIAGANQRNAQVGPPMQDLNNSGNPGDPIYIGGYRVDTDPRTSSAQTIENRWGEGADWLSSPVIAWQDLKKTIGDASIYDIVRWIDRHTKVFGPVR